MAEEYVIPPGQEKLVGAMLGNGVALPDDCRLATGSIEKTIVKATYACPSGEVIVELANPTAAPADATRTKQFALRVEHGMLPPDLQNALLSRIREREAEFRWTHLTPATATPIQQRRALPVLTAAVVLVVLVLAVWLLRRRRVRASQR
jgi:hypothetical protein